MSSYEFLGPYRIGPQLGRGGMGSVFAGVHEKTGEKVAVKLIAQHVADEPRFRRRFDAEIQTLQRLRHPGIVRLVGFGEENGRLFYSMELVEGESLQKRISREKRIDWRLTIDIAIQICAALKHAHDIGVIHRDLKPANLILTDNDTVKLVDFGIAKIFGDGEQTMVGSVLGTADYMAPEQAESKGITTRTDLYALGSVMYAMLTGRPPFTGKRTTDVITSLKRDRPVPLDLIDPDLPDALVELIHELLEKEPDQRPPTALVVMNRLKAMRAGLQREQTMLVSASPTASDEPLPSIDSEGNTSGDGISSAATGVVRPADDRRRTIVSNSPGKKALDRRSSAQGTISSGAGQTLTPGASSDEPVEVAAGPQTHFQTVEASGVGRDQSDSSDTDHHWIHTAMLVVMIGVLLAGVIWFVQSTQPPGAEEAYERIKASEQLQAMDDFLRRFPDDPRYQEVFDLRMGSRLDKTLKRLKAQQKLGVADLSAMEQGFLDAMEQRNQDPTKTREKIGYWLDIHDDSAGDLSEVEQDLVQMAKHELDRMANRPESEVMDPKAAELIERIKHGIENSSREESRKMLEGILSLYQDDAWALPAVEEARRQLQALEEFSDE